MPRNAEVIRQWTILRELESSRRLTIDEMAEKTGVTTRTIRRDLEALQFVGFPIYDEVYDGKKYWMLEQKAFKRLDTTGFTFAELSALYFSRTLVECLSATPFQVDVTSAFDKLAAALTPGMRQFLDRLPLVIQAKAEPGSQVAASRTREIGQLLDATLQHRRAIMRYHSFSSDREKEYTIEPSRVVFAQGALYLVAYVPEYLGPAHVRRRPHQVAVAHRRAIRAGRRRRGSLCALARRAPGRSRAHRDSVRAAHRALRAGAAVAFVAGDSRRGRRTDRRHAERVERLRPAQLDPRLRRRSRGSSRPRRWRRRFRPRPRGWRRCTAKGKGDEAEGRRENSSRCSFCLLPCQ